VSTHDHLHEAAVEDRRRWQGAARSAAANVEEDGRGRPGEETWRGSWDVLKVQPGGVVATGLA